jgi:hypothetical protein
MCARLERHLARLAEAGRCIWQKEVWMRLPALPGDRTINERRGRIDYVVALDGGWPIGIEAKVGVFRTAQFGDQLRQCHDYTRGVISPQVLPRDALQWQHRPIYAVFLACEMPVKPLGSPPDAAYYARRLMSPFRVGFVTNHRWQGLHLSLGCENRWWSERDGYRDDAFARAQKLGSGKRDPQGGE